jgi:hypothetical protein
LKGGATLNNVSASTLVSVYDLPPTFAERVVANQPYEGQEHFEERLRAVYMELEREAYQKKVEGHLEKINGKVNFKDSDLPLL